MRSLHWRQCRRGRRLQNSAGYDWRQIFSVRGKKCLQIACIFRSCRLVGSRCAGALHRLRFHHKLTRSLSEQRVHKKPVTGDRVCERSGREGERRAALHTPIARTSVGGGGGGEGSWVRTKLRTHHTGGGRGLVATQPRIPGDCRRRNNGKNQSLLSLNPNFVRISSISRYA